MNTTETQSHGTARRWRVGDIIKGGGASPSRCTIEAITATEVRYKIIPQELDGYHVSSLDSFDNWATRMVSLGAVVVPNTQAGANGEQNAHNSMAQLILTEEEKAAISWLDMDHDALGKLFRKACLVNNQPTGASASGSAKVQP